jgi:DNA-binding PadR family transcriptional regulator
VASAEKKKPALGGRSPLRAVVLAVVLEGPGHGYEIAARLAWRVGPSWRIYAKHLYPILKSLEQDGYVRSEDVPASTRPGSNRSKKDRLVYYPTPTAAKAREEWMQAPASLTLMRPDIHARLIFSQPEEAPRLLEMLKQYEQDVVGLVEMIAELEPAADTWQGRWLEHTRASVARQLGAERESIVEARLDIEEFLAGSR